MNRMKIHDIPIELRVEHPENSNFMNAEMAKENILLGFCTVTNPQALACGFVYVGPGQAKTTCSKTQHRCSDLGRRVPGHLPIRVWTDLNILSKLLILHK